MLFVDYQRSPDEAAEEFTVSVLRITQRDRVKYGAASPIGNCPECENEGTLVELGAHVVGAGKFGYVCFQCGEGYAPNSLDECGSCGHLFRTTESHTGICAECLDEKFNAD